MYESPPCLPLGLEHFPSPIDNKITNIHFSSRPIAANEDVLVVKSMHAFSSGKGFGPTTNKHLSSAVTLPERGPQRSVLLCQVSCL